MELADPEVDVHLPLVGPNWVQRAAQTGVECPCELGLRHEEVEVLQELQRRHLSLDRGTTLSGDGF